MAKKQFLGVSLLVALVLALPAALWMEAAQAGVNQAAAAGEGSPAPAKPPALEPASGAETSPPLPEGTGAQVEGGGEALASLASPPGALKAVLIKSWGNCSSNRVLWEQLNASWQSYGAIPVWFDYAHPGLCDGPVTYEKLAASGAHVLVLSDPAGGGKQFSASEIAAIQGYLQEGHGLVGTYAVFQYALTDNRGLAALFGLAGSSFNTAPAPVVPTYHWFLADSPLAARLPDPYASAGYPYAQVPAAGSWSLQSLAGARYAGKTADQRAAITLYDAAGYRAVYIASMPEYDGGAGDAQFLYNAVTYAAMRASGRTPLILIPGLMGSRLFQGASGQEIELWADLGKLTSLFSFPHPLMALELAEDGIAPAKDDPAYTSIHTLAGSPGIVTRLKGNAWGLNVDEDFYATMVDHLLARGYVENVNLWLHPYDWRKDVRASADNLDLLIRDIHRQTGSAQVDLLAHSLGGLVTRRYLADASRAAGVRQAIILGTPFAGTPKAFYALIEGECLYKLPGIGYCLPKKHVLHALVPNYASIYQIMPNRDYFRLKGGGFYGRSRSIDVTGGCSDCLSFDETYNRASAPNLNLGLFAGAVQFHTQVQDFSDWNGVPVTIIAGQNQQTLVGVREYLRWSWTALRMEIVREPVYRTSGDGTVTLLSIRLANGETGLDLLGNAAFRSFDASHMDLVAKPEILAYVDSVLDLEVASGVPGMAEAAVTEISGAQIVAYGARAIHAYDAAGNHTGPGEDPDLVEESIPGSAYFTAGEFIALALAGGQPYTITVVPSGLQPVDIRLIRATMDASLESSLYLGIPAGEDSLITLSGDPYVANAWTLEQRDGGGKVEIITPTNIFPADGRVDGIPPSTSISLEGVLGDQGWYVSPVTVILAAGDDPGGSGVARIEYAFANEREVRIYTGPFQVDPQEVSRIYAVAVDLAGNMSPQASQARIGPDKVFIPLLLR